MISMTSREADSHFFTDVHRAISPEAPDIMKLVEVANKHQVTFASELSGSFMAKRCRG